ncbi:MAG: AraC family transcriptional regulator [Clostridia bacterium]|nr:AraC family transcriptional regulator [Clostridia bacterium]
MASNTHTIYNYPWIPRGRGMSKYYYELLRDANEQVVCDIRREPFITPPHVHSCLEFMYCAAGRISGAVGDEKFVLEQGQFAAVSAFVRHEFYAPEPSEACLLVIPQRYLTGYSKRFERRTFAHTVRRDDAAGTIKSCHANLWRLLHRYDIYAGIEPTLHEQMLTGQLSAFVGMMIHTCGLRENTAATPLITAALDYIHAHFREEIRIPELSRQLYCHQQTLSDQFRDVFGMTIKAYINHLRANEVCTLLAADASLTEQEAAERAGFGSVRSMLRAYQAEFHCTPTENR